MLTLKKAIAKLGLKAVAGYEDDKTTITGVYIGDLLSWVMANIEKGNAWITIQTNVNIIAVALLGEASCIIIAENAEIDEATINRANEEGFPLFQSPLNAYEIAIKLSGLLGEEL